jgi:hypothetical protein
MKRPEWLGESRATKADKQKKARQQTDQRMNIKTPRAGGTASERQKWSCRPTIPLPRPREKAAPDKKNCGWASRSALAWLGMPALRARVGDF